MRIKKVVYSMTYVLMEFDREILTTVSTKGVVSGCSSINPPATLSVTPSSIYHTNHFKTMKPTLNS
ncbi:hypothetical protein Hanom_Chr09g00856301 [Helianthus anomalus]